MTTMEAVRAFRAQVPVTLLAAPHLGFRADIKCRRIEAIEWRIQKNGKLDISVKAEGAQGRCTYTGDPKDFALSKGVESRQR